ncbi:aspartate aminotransferase [Clostridium pasteurianum DSM 525 = ATCC 6013]|uniref:Aminotransferase n=1 Tax=Clostridium pasteurianum DSM 525 = ATCC 6013 TaxID=1262449 RepID=A0A0H3J2D8_CLOPA|nr:pyridoxal phosphate-dependent aminotransferase [Clostridium pasteurianum]AJA48091.1 aspartate aminotransferase [Clostridium pasteurianum DSM 525 = ATCC 6013]AJA52079.1 aspartate aminotransferase [Clostridium pasteurianum DSM 525 = ATCC 6013]AOZ75359.1 aspartate aminotransferase [Clostridium pasteurianum DSM 525 = ATCC 6013]AOZ79154.1 aspartate aminotransferase [Clostridium pasteurianum]ELP60756.1 aspartate aminotransferase [Clostridium pasteurianum DSM 525 = ATCC 6013]
MIFSNKAKNISPSLTLAITAKVKEMKKNGIDVIGFGAGEPDFNTPKNIQNAAIKAMKDGFTKYTAASGIIELKKAIINKFKKDNNLTYDISQIIVSNGAKQCISNVFQAILNPMDEVIISSPYWVTYPELVKLYDGVPVIISTEEKNSFKFNVEDLKRVVTPKTKAIILNSPNNPTGTVYLKEEIQEIAEFCRKHDIFIISDEIYEKLIYGDFKHTSIASINEDAFNRTIVINGLSKTYAMTGWRVGYAASGNTEIIKLMSNIQGHTTANPNSIAQYASVEALDGDQSSVEFMISQFKDRRNYMVEKINSINNLSCTNPEGAFYVMMNISKLIGKKINGEIINGSIDFAESLLDDSKVGVVPGDAFGVSEYVRLSYATSMENIKSGLDRIDNFVSKIN